MSDSTPRSEQRRALRHREGNLAVTLRQTGLRGIIHRPQTATWMDYNRHGMSFETERRLKVGDRVLLDIGLKGALAMDVPAIVRNVRPASSGAQRCGVQFDVVQAAIQSQKALVDIENILRTVTPRSAKDSMLEQQADMQQG